MLNAKIFKIMTNEYLERIAQDEGLQEDFIITFSEEFATDDEPARKKFSRLYEAYKEHHDIVNDILMTLCGWTMESLAEKTFE